MANAPKRTAVSLAVSAAAPVEATRSVREKYGITGDYLFYPAQFWAHKNHVNLLLALKLLQSRLERPLSVVFVGADHGNLQHVKATADQLGLTDRVHFLGFVPRDVADACAVALDEPGLGRAGRGDRRVAAWPGAGDQVAQRRRAG